MYVLMNICSEFAFIFFTLIVIFGGFFVVNLFLAVLLEEFLEKTQAEEANKVIEVRHTLSTTASSEATTRRFLGPGSRLTREAHMSSSLVRSWPGRRKSSWRTASQPPMQRERT